MDASVLSGPPPEYSVHNELPPDYSSTSKFTIAGEVFRSPLVQISHLKAHLNFLRAIRNLRDVLEAGQDARIPVEALKLEASQRWAWFVGLAVERFARWVRVVRSLPLRQWVEEEMPPVDVLMVWQAYLLNPLWYAEDMARMPALTILRRLEGRLLSALVSVEDISTYSPGADQQSNWYERTQTIYDPLDAMGSLEEHALECPECGTALGAPFLSSDGTGYLQQDFAFQCTNCAFVITREVLSVVKFAKDLVKDPVSTADRQRYSNGVYMAGTFWSAWRGPSSERAKAVKIGMREAHPLNKPSNASTDEWLQHIYRATNYSMRVFKAATLSQLAGKGYNVQRVFGAYIDDRPFSVNLLGAVIRQGAFIDKLQELQWLEEGHFGEDAEDDLVLRSAIARYHAFLDLISTNPKVMHVPTLDIDLVWHTHQMMGSAYLGFSARYIKYLIDHPDTVEQNRLGVAFDLTCRAWRERFGLPYIYCGCPLPGDKVGERLTRLKQRVLHRSGPGGELVPLQRADATMATHGSEHNSVSVSGLTDKQTERKEKVARRQRRAAAKAKAKGMNMKSEINVEHEPAFMSPIAIYDVETVEGKTIVGSVLTALDNVGGSGGGSDGFAAPMGQGGRGTIGGYHPAGLI